MILHNPLPDPGDAITCPFLCLAREIISHALPFTYLVSLWTPLLNWCSLGCVEKKCAEYLCALFCLRWRVTFDRPLIGLIYSYNSSRINGYESLIVHLSFGQIRSRFHMIFESSLPMFFLPHFRDLVDALDTYLTSFTVFHGLLIPNVNYRVFVIPIKWYHMFLGIKYLISVLECHLETQGQQREFPTIRRSKAITKYRYLTPPHRSRSYIPSRLRTSCYRVGKPIYNVKRSTLPETCDVLFCSWKLSTSINVYRNNKGNLWCVEISLWSQKSIANNCFLATKLLYTVIYRLSRNGKL